MRLIINVNPLSSTVWEGHLASEELDALGAGEPAFGATSVVLLTETPRMVGERTMIVDTRSSVVVNRGMKAAVVFVACPPVAVPRVGRPGSGDRDFLANLPPLLSDLGKELLVAFRERWPGELLIAADGSFVDSPTLTSVWRIEPRDPSIRLYVDGDVAETRDGLRPAANGDRFMFQGKSEGDIPAALQVLDAARRA